MVGRERALRAMAVPTGRAVFSLDVRRLDPCERAARFRWWVAVVRSGAPGACHPAEIAEVSVDVDESGVAEATVERRRVDR
jgi:hypothetical protein